MAVEKLEFQKVYDDFAPRIRRYLTRLAGESEAEDLTQEVFAKVSRALEAFRGESQLSTWIYRIATNTARDRQRRSLAGGGKEKTIPLESFAEGEGDGDSGRDEGEASSEGRLIREEMNGCIREIIATLPDAYQSVIILSEMEGMKDAEIAAILGLSLQAAKIRLHRARAKLKESLTSSCVFYRDERNEFACDRKPSLVAIEDLKSYSK